MKSEALADAGTPIYVARFDCVRVPATDYRPVWVGSLADDVTRVATYHPHVVSGGPSAR